MTKRIFDFSASLAALLLLSPFFLLLALLVWVKIGSPIFFTQTRPGHHGKAFTIIKFRTMTNTHGTDGVLLTDAERLTRFGRFLRATSLDELPELWNVLKGDMSLVGPRPLAMTYLSLYTEAQARRHELKPGITGWAQINGRNSVSWRKKFEMDVWYVDNQSLVLDIKIILLTFKKVLARSDVQEGGKDQVESFNGKN